MFDLDETLVRTEDLKDVREACLENADPANLQAVKQGLASKPGRHIYSQGLLKRIRAENPTLKLGVFTRSPRSYAEFVLNWAYPECSWDIIVAFEDVESTKPYGDGIRIALNELDITYLNHAMMVGDSHLDIRAAYNCGCIAVLSTKGWPQQRTRDHWRALKLIPDAIIEEPEKLLDILSNPLGALPELERRLDEDKSTIKRKRFDKMNHFLPNNFSNNEHFPIYLCGRSFSKYESLSERRKWHELTESIENHKDADIFPNEWIYAIREFILGHFLRLGPVVCKDLKIHVTVIPHRPGRKARLEKLLNQLQRSLHDNPFNYGIIQTTPDLLAYKSGVKSQHKNFLNANERFNNVRDNLFVKRPELITKETQILVIDDVCTTGASLIYAAKYLKTAGATYVACLALAKNVGDVLK